MENGNFERPDIRKLIVSIVLAVLFISVLWFCIAVKGTRKTNEEVSKASATTTPQSITAVEMVYKEPVKVDTFVPIKDCKWSTGTQKKLAKICKKHSISFEMCIAQAFVESTWNEKANGDNGRAYGAWQIHPRVWSEELKRWGFKFSDMYDLEKACEVYCRIMKSHFEKFDDTEFALMAWRWGGDMAMANLNRYGADKYAKSIMKLSQEFENRLED